MINIVNIRERVCNLLRLGEVQSYAARIAAQLGSHGLGMRTIAAGHDDCPALAGVTASDLQADAVRATDDQQ